MSAHKAPLQLRGAEANHGRAPVRTGIGADRLFQLLDELARLVEGERLAGANRAVAGNHVYHFLDRGGRVASLTDGVEQLGQHRFGILRLHDGRERTQEVGRSSKRGDVKTEFRNGGAGRFQSGLVTGCEFHRQGL